MAPIFRQVRIVVRGGGDLGSGVVYRLQRAGFPVAVLELAQPLFVRRGVAYGAAVYEGSVTVDGITARLVDRIEAAGNVWMAGEVPVLIDPAGATLAEWQPTVIVDARMAKRPLDTRLDEAPLVVALGPGFEAGVHCHAVVETNRGHYLGRVYWQGHAEPDTGIPGQMNGVAALRVLRAPEDGFVRPLRSIGDTVRAGDIVAEVNDQPVTAKFDGVVRGLIHPTVAVSAGLKIGDIDPRAKVDHCFTISEKSLAVGGGVLEAVLVSPAVRHRLGLLPGVANAT